MFPFAKRKLDNNIGGPKIFRTGVWQNVNYRNNLYRKNEKFFNSRNTNAVHPHQQDDCYERGGGHRNALPDRRRHFVDKEVRSQMCTKIQLI